MVKNWESGVICLPLNPTSAICYVWDSEQAYLTMLYLPFPHL